MKLSHVLLVATVGLIVVNQAQATQGVGSSSMIDAKQLRASLQANSVLPPGARVVAGKEKDEFYILAANDTPRTRAAADADNAEATEMQSVSNDEVTTPAELPAKEPAMQSVAAKPMEASKSKADVMLTALKPIIKPRQQVVALKKVKAQPVDEMMTPTKEPVMQSVAFKSLKEASKPKANAMLTAARKPAIKHTQKVVALKKSKVKAQPVMLTAALKPTIKYTRHVEMNTKAKVHPVALTAALKPALQHTHHAASVERIKVALKKVTKQVAIKQKKAPVEIQVSRTNLHNTKYIVGYSKQHAALTPKPKAKLAVVAQHKRKANKINI